MNRTQSSARFVRTTAVCIATGASILLVAAAPARAAKVSRPVLKEFFEKGDKPTQSQFGSLIDSMVNLIDDRYLLGLRVFDDKAVLLEPGAVVDGSIPFGPASGLADDWAGQSGFLGFAMQSTGSSGVPGEVYYGYLQVRSGEPGSTDPYPMFVTYLVYQDQSGAPIELSFVPEPASWVLALMAAAGGALCLKRRRKTTNT